jgi:hypothetical protein
MPIDSAMDRRAVAMIGLQLTPSVTPDATPDEAWRYNVAWSYQLDADPQPSSDVGHSRRMRMFYYRRAAAFFLALTGA